MFVKKASRILDSIYKCHVGLETHLEDLRRVSVGERPPRYSCMECPDPADEPHEYQKRAEACMVTCGLHRHTFTCHHSSVGNLMCRMCFPRRLIAVRGGAAV